MIPLWCRKGARRKNQWKPRLVALLIANIVIVLPILGVSPGLAETRIIPKVSVSERYDTNIFFSPQSFVPGRTLWDLSTTVDPQVQIISKNRHADTNLTAGLSGVAFVNNPDLSFVSTNVSGAAILDGWVGQFIPRLKLTLSESFLFTPEPPAFLTGGRPDPTADAFTRGIQAYRANTYRNITSVGLEYPVSRIVSVNGGYSFSLFRVGQLFVLGEPGSLVGFFNTNLHTWSGGPGFRLTRSDHVNVFYQHVIMDLSGEGQQFGVTTRTIQAQYSKVASGWKATLSAGATQVDPGDKIYGSGKLTFAADYDESTRLRIAASRAIAPAFFGAGGAYVSTTAQVAIDRRLSKVLTLTGSVNYAINETTPADIVKFETLTVVGQFRYRLSRSTIATLSYDYSRYSVDGGAILFPYQIGRSLFLVGLITQWN